MPKQRRCPDELRERAVRLLFEPGRPVAHVAKHLGIKYESLRSEYEADAGKRADLLTSSDRDP